MTKFFGLLLALTLSACATASFVTKDHAHDVHISGSRVYIYSFLDVRNADLGRTMIANVNERLVARLAEHGVTTQLVTYSSTLIGKPPAQQTVSIPIGEIVAAHQAEEAALGANFRLIIVPDDMRIYGASESYQISWTLVDVTTNQPVWSTALRGGRTVWYNQDEDSRGRANTFVDGVIAQMQAAGLFNSGAGQAPTTAAL